MDPINMAVAVVGVVVTALVAGRPPPKVTRARLAGGLFVGVHWFRLVVAGDVGNWDLALMACHFVATVIAIRTGLVLAGLRELDEALVRARRDGVEPLDPLSSELAAMVDDGGSLGFEPLPDGAIVLGPQHVVFLTHPDGTYLTLVETAFPPAGFGFSTPLTDGAWVESVPWLHGIVKSVIRVPGASMEELLEHHRAGLAERVGSGSQPRPVDAEGGVQLLMAGVHETVGQVLSQSWRNALGAVLRAAFLQSPLKFLVRR